MVHWGHTFNPKRRVNEWPKQLQEIMWCQRANENTVYNAQKHNFIKQGTDMVLSEQQDKWRNCESVNNSEQTNQEL